MVDRDTRARGIVEVEQKVLGYYLVYQPPGCPLPRSSPVRPEHFLTSDVHRVWWREAQRRETGFSYVDLGIDPVDADKLARAAATMGSIRAFEQRLIEEWAIQWVVDGSETVLRRWQRGDIEAPEDAIDFLRRVLGDAESGCMRRSRTHRDVATGLLHRWSRAVRGGGDERPRTIPFPWYPLQMDLGGLTRGKLHVVYGFESHHKTTFALEILDHAAEHGFRSLYWTAEDSSADLSARRLARRTRALTTRALVTGTMPGGDDALLAPSYESQALSTLEGRAAECLRYIDDGIPRVSQVFGTLRAEAARGLDIAVFDHWQLIRPDRNAREQNVFVQELAAGWQSICKELDIVGIVLSQIVARGAREGAAGKRVLRPPRKADVPFSSTWGPAAYGMLGVHALQDEDGNRMDVLSVDASKWKHERPRQFRLRVDAKYDALTAIESPA